MLDTIFSSEIYRFVVIPLLIFIARILDVSIGTIRVIFIARGQKMIAPVLGFFEVLIWLMAIQQIMSNLSNWVTIIAYAAGFAAGTFAGMVIEEKISVGKVIIRMITKKDPDGFLSELKRKEHFVSSIEEDGYDSKVKVIFIVIDRVHLHDVIKKLKGFDGDAFYTVEDVRFASEGSKVINRNHRKKKSRFGLYRKGK